MLKNESALDSRLWACSWVCALSATGKDKPAWHIGLARVSANGRPRHPNAAAALGTPPLARGGVTRDKRLSPSTSLGWSRTGPAFRPIVNAELRNLKALSLRVNMPDISADRDDYGLNTYSDASVFSPL